MSPKERQTIKSELQETKKNLEYINKNINNHTKDVRKLANTKRDVSADTHMCMYRAVLHLV